MKRKFDLFKLRELEQKDVKGGFITDCQCSCAYANCPGGSSFGDNGGANYKKGYVSVQWLPQC